MQKRYHYIKQVGNYARIPKKIIPIIFSFLLAFQPLVLKAQQYPVKMVPVLLPPYSLKLSEYATSTQTKLRLQVMMTDLQEPQHPTGIKFSLESSLGAVPIATSQSFVSGMSPFTLYPGSNITLTNADLRPLFELQNLAGLNASQYAQTLPEGIYQFCFQAYDYYTKHNLSAKTCAQAYLTQYEPPLLNLPQNAEKVQVEGDIVGSKGIVFQWMPRQVAPNTHYIFILKELWDAGRSPVAGFLSSPILWKEKTYATSLYYSPEKTRLIPGKRYAWQVQAVSGNPVVGANPTEDNGVYKNNGLSEIFYFDYVEDCKVPTFLMAKNAGRGRVELSWTMPGQPSGLYSIQYRKRDSNTDWQTEESYQTRYILTGLENQTEYEYRIGTVCGNLQNFNPSPLEGETSGNAYAYSAIQYFTTDSEEKESSKYQCGVMPSIDLTNKAPLQTALGTNEVFMAGDFPVTVLSAQGSNGIYSGEGYIQVPYFGDTKIKVVFNNIKLNTDKQLISGVVETTYDANEKNVEKAREVIEAIIHILGESVDKIIEKIKDSDDANKYIAMWKDLLYENNKLTSEQREIIEGHISDRSEVIKTIKILREKIKNGDADELLKKYLVHNLLPDKDLSEKEKNIELIKQNFISNFKRVTGENNDFLIIEIDSISPKKKKYRLLNGAYPKQQGKFIGQIKVGKENTPTYYIWTGNLWSKVIDNGDGTFSATVYSKKTHEITEIVTWHKNNSLQEISNKFLSSKNATNFVEGFRTLWPCFEIALSLGTIAPEVKFHKSNYSFKVHKKLEHVPRFETAYDIAKNGGKHHKFYLQYLNKSKIELEKGIRSFQRQINEHIDKIKNPEKYIPTFRKLDIRQQEALINKKWPSDIKRQEEQMQILKQILKTKK